MPSARRQTNNSLPEESEARLLGTRQTKQPPKAGRLRRRLLPFRPRAIDGYFRYKQQSASKHGSALLRAPIGCALVWRAQWRLLRSLWLRACAARPFPASAARRRMHREGTGVFSSRTMANRAYSLRASPSACFLSLPPLQLVHCACSSKEHCASGGRMQRHRCGSDFPTDSDKWSMWRAKTFVGVLYPRSAVCCGVVRLQGAEVPC
jgi:hypothetical protein